MKTINITKHEGKIQYEDYVLERLKSAFDMLANGKYTLTIKKDVQRRSLDQNALFWMWAKCIESETGTTMQDIHDYYCAQFLRRTAIINGKEKAVTSGTSKLNTAQFADFLNKIQADAATEFGIKLPTPEDLYFEAFREEYEKYITNY